VYNAHYRQMEAPRARAGPRRRHTNATRKRAAAVPDSSAVKTFAGRWRWYEFAWK